MLLHRTVQIAIREEAEELLSEKRVISGAINIRTNKDQMKASGRPPAVLRTLFVGSSPPTC